MGHSVKFKVIEFKMPYVVLEGDYSRLDIASVFVKVHDRVYRGTNLVGIPVGKWVEFRKNLVALSDVEIETPNSIWKQIDEWMNLPTYKVELATDHIIIRNTEKSIPHDWLLREMTGCIYDNSSGRKYYKLNLANAHSLFETLASVPNVVYSPEVRDYIIKQIEDRHKLDEIAKLDDIELDVDLKGNVPRPFQKVGVKFIDAASGRVLLGDEMGLGKTWQSIMYGQLIFAKKILVVCPASLRINWSREINRLTGEVPLILSGTIPTNFDIELLLTKPSRFTICNYDILGRPKKVEDRSKDENGMLHVKDFTIWPWVEILKLCKFDLLIVDEAHYIKNPDANRSYAVRELKEIPKVICMTGTPVLNRPGELWPILNILKPGDFPSYKTFLNQYTWDGKTPRDIERLRHLLKNIMIRRLKKDVVKELPPINRINEYHIVSEAAKKSYDNVMIGIYQTLQKWGVGIKQSEVTHILERILRLKQILAFDKMERTSELATELYDSSEGEDNRKVIVFSQFVDVIKGIHKRLGNESVSFTGEDNMVYRMEQVDQFQTNDKVHFLCCTTKVASEGLNLTKAGSVIFNDLMWTPASHSQAEGRAYGRLGNPHSVNSYYVVAEKTIEDWIRNMLTFKDEVIKETVEDLDEDRKSEMNVSMGLITAIRDGMWITQ